MSDTFFNPEEDYSVPEQVSSYMKFVDGENKFRILGSFAEGSAIRGVSYWKTVDGQRKPIRLPMGSNVPVAELEMNKFGEYDQPKYFWTMPVWNYTVNRVQLLEITQKTVLNYIKQQISNPKWGDPRDYDFIVTRGKEGERTVYSTTNDPKEPLSEQASKAYSEFNCDITKLFEGLDPFATK